MAGVRKMPMPMIRLTTIIVASKVVSFALIDMRLFALRDNSIQGGMFYKSLFFLFFVEAEPALAILRIDNLG